VATARTLHEWGVPVRLDVYGDGPHRGELIALAGEAPVVFHGHLADRDELARRLAAADVAMSVCPGETSGAGGARRRRCTDRVGDLGPGGAWRTDGLTAAHAQRWGTRPTPVAAATVLVVTTADAVRRVGLALPRTYEREVRGRWKLKVKQIVYVAFSRDELAMGFGFPKAERDGLVASDPETFFLPPTSDLRYQWVCAQLTRLDDDEMRELVVDAWRMCVPKMLHELPEQPEPAAATWSAMEAGEWGELRDLLHPRVELLDRDVLLRGRSAVLAHLRNHSTPRPPGEVEVRDGRLYRWVSRTNRIGT